MVISELISLKKHMVIFYSYIGLTEGNHPMQGSSSILVGTARHMNLI